MEAESGLQSTEAGIGASQTSQQQDSRQKVEAQCQLKYSHLQKRKKKQSKKTAAIKTAEAAEKAEEEESEWNGAIGRVVGETAKAAWQGLVVTVEKAKGSQLLCQIPSKGSQ